MFLAPPCLHGKGLCGENAFYSLALLRETIIPNLSLLLCLESLKRSQLWDDGLVVEAYISVHLGLLNNCPRKIGQEDVVTSKLHLFVSITL